MAVAVPHLYQSGVRPKPRDRLGKLALFEGRHIFGCGLWGLLQPRSLNPHRSKHGGGMLVPKANNELVRVNGFDVELLKNRRWEIAQVERDDQSRPAVNRSRQHVTVIEVGKRQRRNDGLVLGDEAIGDVLIHELPASSQARGRDIRAIGQDVPCPLIMDLIRPASLEQVRQSEPHKQITERCRVQDARIVEDDSSHGSVAHIQFLAQRLEFIECGVTPGLEILLVGE